MELVCNCDVDDVIIECGSIIVIVIMTVNDDVDVVALQGEFQRLAASLPPSNIIVDSITLGLTSDDDGMCTSQ